MQNNNIKQNKKGNFGFDFKTALFEDLKTISKLDYDVLDDLRNNFLSELLGFQGEFTPTPIGYNYKNIFEPTPTTLPVIEYLLCIKKDKDKKKILKVTNNDELVARIIYSADFLYKKGKIDKMKYNEVESFYFEAEECHFEEDYLDLEKFRFILEINNDLLSNTILSNLLGFQGNCVYEESDYENIFKLVPTTLPVIKHLLGITSNYTYKKEIRKITNNAELVARILYAAKFLFNKGKIEKTEYNKVLSLFWREEKGFLSSFENIFELDSDDSRHNLLLKSLGFKEEEFEPVRDTLPLIMYIYIIVIVDDKEKIRKITNSTELVGHIIHSAGYFCKLGKMYETEYRKLISGLDPDFLSFSLDGNSNLDSNSKSIDDNSESKKLISQEKFKQPKQGPLVTGYKSKDKHYSK